MASSVGGAAAMAKHPRVLLPFTCDSLRIPDELAAEIGAGEALVVGPSAGKVKLWRVEVGWDGDVAFLGRGWPEFAGACGVDAGWLLVLRHRGRGVLTVKVFDASSCLRELVAQPPAAAAVEATTSGQGTRKLQFIRVLPKDFMKKMLIPAKFMQHYILNEHLNNRTAIIFGPLGKVSHIEIEMNQSDVFFSGGWSQFLVLHDITESNALLLRYEGNMVFTVKVFEPDGCQRESKTKDIRMQQVSTLPDIEEQQEAPSISIQKHYKNDLSSNNGEKKPKGPVTCLTKAPLWTKSVFEVGPPSWIKKQINANTLRELALQTAFCDAIGLQEPCIITLKTSMSSTKSWQVHALPRRRSYRLRLGWSRFCKENDLKLGDICTFDIVETTLWLVVVTRCKEKMNQLYYEKPKRKKERSSGHGQKRPKSSISRIGCVFEIGPPAWLKKEINTSTISNHLSVPLSLCQAIGFQEPCTMITLKTSVSSTKSWQARLLAYRNGNQMTGSGWKSFCCEND
ncbi:hypothetical protein PVAP13_7KG131200 [Panicum virgatum]|uniref:TF-B3 domain-containing protein n=1 Tax=Panicum virgatum TaxID=38727 RepID=A0A8T0QFJ2_PANVG|nr:hypothetical protein PVAP13_7KG131200 [Panicum virgatum]